MTFNGLFSDMLPQVFITYLFSNGSNATDSTVHILPAGLRSERVKVAVICTFQIGSISSKIKEKTENKQKEPPLSLF